MTQRKPPGASFESFADAQIRKAREEGLFDDLPGKGKPLEDLQEAYDPLWWVKKLVAREGLSLLPPSLEIRKRVEQETKRILALESEARVRSAVEALNQEIRKINRGNTGPPTTQAVLDVEAMVERWRAAREREGRV